METHMTIRPPLDLEGVITRLAETGKLTQFSIVRTLEGRYQANLQRPNNRASYKVCIKPTAIEAAWAALGPDHGQTWDDHLKLEETEEWGDLI